MPGQGRICLVVDTPTSAAFDCSTAEGAATGHLYMMLGNCPASTTPTTIYGLAPDTDGLAPDIAPAVSVTHADGHVADLATDHGIDYGTSAGTPTSIKMHGGSRSYTIPLTGSLAQRSCTTCRAC